MHFFLPLCFENELGLALRGAGFGSGGAAISGSTGLIGLFGRNTIELSGLLAVGFARTSGLARRGTQFEGSEFVLGG